MNNFIYYNPTKVVFGKNIIPGLGKEISKYSISKVLLLAGGGSIKTNSVYDSVVNSLNQSGIEWEELWGVRPNPSLSHARQAIEIMKTKNLQGIIAVGGGSVIDEAKAIAAGFYLTDVWNAFEGIERINDALPLFTVLTLSGTCSEMDAAAVLTNDNENKKWAIKSEHLFPKVSFIDPSVQSSLPWNQTVNGAIDALSHTFEYYFLGNDEEIVLSSDEALMRTIITCTEKLKSNQSDYSARASLAWSAVLALNGYSGVAMRGGDWAVHGIEHSLSALNPKTAHGAGLAVVYPAFIQYCRNESPEIFARWAKNVWNCDNIASAINKMKNVFVSWGAPISLKELAFSENDIERIAANAYIRGNMGTLKSLDYNDIVNILKLAL